MAMHMPQLHVWVSEDTLQGHWVSPSTHWHRWQKKAIRLVNWYLLSQLSDPRLFSHGYCFFLLVFLFVCLFWDRISLHSPGSPEAYYVVLALNSHRSTHLCLLRAGSECMCQHTSCFLLFKEEGNAFSVDTMFLVHFFRPNVLIWWQQT